MSCLIFHSWSDYKYEPTICRKLRVCVDCKKEESDGKGWHEYSEWSDKYYEKMWFYDSGVFGPGQRFDGGYYKQKRICKNCKIEDVRNV